MPHRVLIPTPLRPYTGQQDAVEADGATVGDVLSSLTSKHGELRRHLYGDDGKLRHFVNIYVNDDDIRYLEKERDRAQGRRRHQHRPVGCRRRAGERSCRIAGGGAADADQRRDPALQPAPDPAGGRRRGAAQAEGRPRALHRRRRARLARRRCISPRPASARSASSISTSSTSATCSGRSCTARRTSAARSSQSATRPPRRRSTRRSRSTAYETALTSENALEIFTRLRRHPRRHRQLLDALSRQRRVRDPRQAERLRQHLPLRGPGVGVRDQGRAVLSLPVSRAAAARAGAELRRGWRAGRAAGRDRHDPGDRGDQAAARRRRDAGRRLLLYDAWNMRFRELKLRRDPDCPVCGDHPTVRELIDYDQFCGITPPQTTAQPASARRDPGSDASQELNAKLDVRRAGIPARRARAERVPDRPHPRLDADSARPGRLAPRRRSRPPPRAARSSSTARWAAAAPRRCRCSRTTASRPRT